MSYEKAIAICRAAAETIPLSHRPARMKFTDTFTPEVVAEMLEILHRAMQTISILSQHSAIDDVVNENLDQQEDYHELMRKIGGEQ